jgi:cell division protein FtsZ
VSLTSDDSPDASVVALGLGSAGNDLLTHLIDGGLKGIQCIAIDTDRYRLHIARAHRKLLMEHSSCPDSGTRGDPEIGRKAAMETSEKLQPIFQKANLVFVLAGMGGGTGSGAAPVISDLSRRSGALVVGIVTKPFSFEGRHLNTAIGGMRKILNTCDTVILLDNHSSDPSSVTLPFGLTADPVGQISCSIVSSIAKTFSNPELLNGELKQLKAMLKRGGLAKVGVGESYSLHSAEEATLNALRHIMPLGVLADASGVFVNFTTHERIRKADIETALELVSRRINPNADLLYGRLPHTGHQNSTIVSLLVTGVSFPYTWGGYRKLPFELHEMEPESGEEERLGIQLDLHQLEFSAQLNL